MSQVPVIFLTFLNSAIIILYSQRHFYITIRHSNLMNRNANLHLSLWKNQASQNAHFVRLSPPSLPETASFFLEKMALPSYVFWVWLYLACVIWQDHHATACNWKPCDGSPYPIRKQRIQLRRRRQAVRRTPPLANSAVLAAQRHQRVTCTSLFHT